MKQRKPRATLFDLDDTIISLSGTAESAWENVCKRFAPQLRNMAPDALLKAVMESRDWFWEDSGRNLRERHNLAETRREVVSRAFRVLGINAPALANEMADAFTAAREETLQPFPGAIETLHHLRNRGIKLGLITNGSAEGQRRKVDRFGLDSIFDCILIEGEFGEGKPAESVYLYVLEQLRVKPDEAWMIGDHLEWDVAVPQALGLVGIWVDFSDSGLWESSNVKPDRIVRSISELVHS